MKLGLKTKNLKQLTIKENPSPSIKTHQFSVDASGTKKKFLPMTFAVILITLPKMKQQRAILSSA